MRTLFKAGHFGRVPVPPEKQFLINFYSQFGEDKYIYNNFFSSPKIKKGFFIELGAFNGVTLSNTKFFEETLDWRGILIEPAPSQFKKLKQNRPKNILVNAAVTLEENKVEFLGDSLVAGMVHTMSDNFKNIWHKDEQNLYLVDGVPFYKILHQYSVKQIDFLSIDVEGGEVEVLKTFDWSIPVGVVAIELDEHNKDKDNSCREILIKNGFIFVKRLSISEIWWHPINHYKLINNSQSIYKKILTKIERIYTDSRNVINNYHLC